MKRIPLPPLPPNDRLDRNDFKGLAKALESFEDINLLTRKQDPGYGYEAVSLFLCEFRYGGKYGLFIYSTETQSFIEEPADLECFNIRNLTELYEKHSSLRINR